MSRFVLQPGNPTAIGGAGEYTLEVITAGGIVWFSDDSTQFNLDNIGQPTAGWALTSDKGSVRRGPYQALYAMCIGQPVTIEAIPHQSLNPLGAGPRPANSDIFSAAVGELLPGASLAQAAQNLLQTAASSLGARVRALLGLGILLLLFGAIDAQAQWGTSSTQTPINLQPGFNQLISNFQANAFTNYASNFSSSNSNVHSVLIEIDDFDLAGASVTFDYFHLTRNKIALPFGPCLSLNALGASGATKLLNTLQSSVIVNLLPSGSILIYCPAPLNGQGSFTFSFSNSVTISASIVTSSDSFSDNSEFSPSMKFCNPSTFSSLFATGPSFCAYNPTDLGVNGIALPPSGTTALSNIIDMRGVKQATLLGSCTQAIIIQANEYAEDGITPIFTGVQLNLAPAVTAILVHIGSEQLLALNGNAAMQTFEFPQRALAFSFMNSTANPGTCTARLFLAY